VHEQVGGGVTGFEGFGVLSVRAWLAFGGFRSEGIGFFDALWEVMAEIAVLAFALPPAEEVPAQVFEVGLLAFFAEAAPPCDVVETDFGHY